MHLYIFKTAQGPSPHVGGYHDGLAVVAAKNYQRAKDILAKITWVEFGAPFRKLSEHDPEELKKPLFYCDDGTMSAVYFADNPDDEVINSKDGFTSKGLPACGYWCLLRVIEDVAVEKEGMIAGAYHDG